MKRDPWFFQQWAFRQKTGSPGRKAVLMALSTLADATTGRCECKQETIAEWVEVDERSVRRHLKALEAAGLLARRPQYRKDRGRRGDEFLLLADGVDFWPDGERVHPDNLTAPPGQEAYPPRGIDLSGQELPLKELPLEQSSTGARIPVVKYNRKTVPADLVATALTCLETFNRATGTAASAFSATGSPSAPFTQVVGAVNDRPDVPLEQWIAGINSMVSNPPDWVSDGINIGSVFGKQAANHTVQRGAKAAQRDTRSALKLVNGGSRRSNHADHPLTEYELGKKM